MKQIALSITCMTLLLVLCACSTQNSSPQVEGHYTYEHAFAYDLYGNHLDVHETGTMDFYPDSTALDSARQVYVATLATGDSARWAFNYISPSRWYLAGDTFYFSGIKESFRMEVVEGVDKEAELAQKIIDVIGGSIDYEYRFHLDTLTTDLMQWSYTYRDGHSDTWTFYRENDENK